MGEGERLRSVEGPRMYAEAAGEKCGRGRGGSPSLVGKFS